MRCTSTSGLVDCAAREPLDLEPRLRVPDCRAPGACRERALRQPPASRPATCRSSRFSPRPATARRRCSRSGPSATGGRSPGSRSTSDDNDPVILLEATSPRRSAASSRSYRTRSTRSVVRGASAGRASRLPIARRHQHPSPRPRARRRPPCSVPVSARAVVAALAEHVPDGSTLVLAGRAPPRLPIARLRAAGRLFEVGVDELALSRREVGVMMRGVGRGARRGRRDRARRTGRRAGPPEPTSLRCR